MGNVRRPTILHRYSGNDGSEALATEFKTNLQEKLKAHHFILSKHPYLAGNVSDSLFGFSSIVLTGIFRK